MIKKILNDNFLHFLERKENITYRLPDPSVPLMKRKKEKGETLIVCFFFFHFYPRFLDGDTNSIAIFISYYFIFKKITRNSPLSQKQYATGQPKNRRGKKTPKPPQNPKSDL